MIVAAVTRGIGIDTTRIADFACLSTAARRLIFTPHELRVARNNPRQLAVRFAAKEAAVKALRGAATVPQLEIRGPLRRQATARSVSRRGEPCAELPIVTVRAWTDGPYAFAIALAP